MTDVENALKEVARVSVERTRAAATDKKLYTFFTDARVMSFIFVVGMFIKREENKEEKDKKTVSIAGFAFFLLGLAYIIFISYALLSEFILHFFEALGSNGLIDAASQRVVDINLYNILIGFRKSLHSAAGLHSNLTPKDFN